MAARVVPALRERREDLPYLIETFIEEANHKFKKEVKGITQAVTEFFNIYPWPGNVRELRGVIRGGVAQTHKDHIGFDDIPCKMIPQTSVEALEEMDLSLRAAEKRHLLVVLGMFNWNRSRTADALGIHRTTLMDKVRSLGIVPPADATDDEPLPPTPPVPPAPKAAKSKAEKA